LAALTDVFIDFTGCKITNDMAVQLAALAEAGALRGLPPSNPINVEALIRAAGTPPYGGGGGRLVNRYQKCFRYIDNQKINYCIERFLLKFR
jgi:hypothetical protein